MNDERLARALDRLVPAPEARTGWDDVLRRTQRRRRRRRRRQTAAVALLAAAGVLVASLAAAGQIGLPVSHSRQPHLLLRGTLTAPRGTQPAGTLQLEVPRAIIAFGRRVFVQPPPTARNRFVPARTVSVRWFLNLRGDRPEDASLLMRNRATGTTLSTLCGPCDTHESGEFDLTRSQTSALFNNELRFALVRDGRRIAAASVALVKSHLRRGLACWGSPATRLHCRRIYTGRP
jgi:hypothetical protein